MMNDIKYNFKLLSLTSLHILLEGSYCTIWHVVIIKQAGFNLTYLSIGLACFDPSVECPFAILRDALHLHCTMVHILVDWAMDKLAGG